MNRLNNVKLCRSCLSAIFDGFNIFETLYQFKLCPSQSQKEVRVAEIFKQLSGINLNENDENVSKYLCLMCLERLFNAYEFFELCKISDYELKTYNNISDTNIEVMKFVNNISSGRDHTLDAQSLSDKDDIPYSDNNDEEDDPDFEIHQQSNINIDVDENTSSSIDKVFDCLKCNEEFPSSTELMRHERVHEGNWSCTECDKILTTKYTFRHHLMLHTGKPLECMVCSRRFSRVADLNRHRKLYHLIGKCYECEKCSKHFYSKSHLISHKLSHLDKIQIENLNVASDVTKQNENKSETNNDKSKLTGENNEEIKCEVGPQLPIQDIESQDDFSFKLNDDHISHEKAQIEIVKTEIPSRFDTIAKYYRCKKCLKKFRNKSNYLRHLKKLNNCQVDINSPTNPKKCHYCTVILDNVADLRIHLELHLDQDPFRCKICNKNYKTWLKLTDHTRQIHLKSKKYLSNHLCTVCGRGLPSAKLLEEHYYVHQDIRNYKCEYCDRAFYTKSGLKQHSGIHTRDGLQCPECGKILADKFTLRHHLTIHYGKKFKCSICEKLFPNISTLNRHLKMHRGERNFQCDRCSKRYMRKGHLNDHIKKVHENSRTISCDECDMEFNHRGSLNKHRRLEHAEKPVYKCYECGKSFGRKSRLNEHHKKFHTMDNHENSETSVQLEHMDHIQYDDNLNEIA